MNEKIVKTNEKIVKIIDENRLVINLGWSHGVKQNDKFAVYVTGDEVFDPDTYQSLGTLDTVKCYLRAVDVLEKMSVCVNAETSLSSLGAAVAAGSSAQLFPITFGGLSSPKRLPVDASEISGGLQPKTQVRVGDFVRKLNDDH